MAPPCIPLEERFWPKVEVGADNQCWLWTAGLFKGRPYGQFQVRADEVERAAAGPVRAHRLAFRLVHGHWPEPQGLHGCDNPLCCNSLSPEHVHEGTHQQNMDEMWSRARHPLPPAVLSQTAVTYARKTYQPGAVSYAQLAEELGVSLTTIWRAVRRVAPYGD